MIVGNKIDLEEKRTVSKQRGLEYAESKKIAFYEVSAKDGTNIDLIFTRIAEGTHPPHAELEKAVTQNKADNEHPPS
jgi:GTPase SAR1 family protein